MHCRGQSLLIWYFCKAVNKMFQEGHRSRLLLHQRRSRPTHVRSPQPQHPCRTPLEATFHTPTNNRQYCTPLSLQFGGQRLGITCLHCVAVLAYIYMCRFTWGLCPDRAKLAGSAEPDDHWSTGCHAQYSQLDVLSTQTGGAPVRQSKAKALIAVSHGLNLNQIY